MKPKTSSKPKKKATKKTPPKTATKAPKKTRTKKALALANSYNPVPKPGKAKGQMNMEYGLLPKYIRVVDQDTQHEVLHEGDDCEHCSHVTGRKVNLRDQGYLLHPHHIKTRGSGGDDVRRNLIRMSPICHTKVESGQISNRLLQQIVDKREDARDRLIIETTKDICPSITETGECDEPNDLSFCRNQQARYKIDFGEIIKCCSLCPVRDCPDPCAGATDAGIKA
jgi:hypothetical protein